MHDRKSGSAFFTVNNNALSPDSLSCMARAAFSIADQWWAHLLCLSCYECAKGWTHFVLKFLLNKDSHQKSSYALRHCDWEHRSWGSKKPACRCWIWALQNLDLKPFTSIIFMLLHHKWKKISYPPLIVDDNEFNWIISKKIIDELLRFSDPMYSALKFAFIGTSW